MLADRDFFTEKPEIPHFASMNTEGAEYYHVSFAARNLNALAITETLLKLIAAAAIIGLSNTPKIGYSSPAATGMPSVL